jgi:DNA primase
VFPVCQFVLQYLCKSGSGLCPFHDYQVESFKVNDEENYWNCFTDSDCGGGSVIDFYMKLKGVDFTTAVKELADMLL